MAWPYAFLDLNDAEKALRRESLNHYALVAHWSAFAPIPIYLVFQVVQKVVRKRLQPTENGSRGDYQRVPGSPLAKAKQMTASGELATKWRKLKWWMGEEVYFLGNYRGERDMWILGTAWMMWLLTLCVVGTGKDYLHLTKRFGIVAVSQMPVQYLLSLKSTNPFAYVFRSSHEEVNRYHRTLGRLIYGLLALHIAFYNYFFFVKEIWFQRLFNPVVFAGFVAAAGISLLMATALPIVRAYSYRIFFITHLFVSSAVPFVLFFHAPSARGYFVECLLVFIMDLAVRKRTGVTSKAKLEGINGTDLFTIKAPIPASKIESFKSHPGSHVYLNLPSGSGPSPLFSLIYNPFTVASVDGDDNNITIVARKRDGPLTTYLSGLANPQTAQPADATLKMDIEAPRGAAAKNLSDLLSPTIQRILLIAGGVGSSFIIPIYKSIIEDNPSANVQVIWAIHKAGDATWPVSTSKPGEMSILNDDRVDLYVTSDMSAGGDPEGDGEGVELRSMPSRNQRGSRQATTENNRRRPDLKKIVDDTFKKGQAEKVAVLVCGPTNMAREVRQHVTPWVVNGREVLWHNESFGW
ncbi:ferric reductase like transmembrane component domain-containing protein [Sarocladium implicatum]|nr:ferric reductase like transmembrane component domain-containing protein [Sarocladium implicatum]